MNDELTKWSEALRVGLLDPLQEDLPGSARFLIALAGAATFFLGWVLFRILDKPGEFSALIVRGFTVDTIAYGIGAVVYTIGFAILASIRKRRHGPTRLFFGGLLLPAVVWTLLSGTVGL